jgi:crossover junction endodeoxyribonuclease RuvC
LKILGIDPGLIQTGFGLINIKNDNEIKLIDYGIIKPLLKDTLPKRLLTIFYDICEIIKIHKPQIFVIEDIFYGKNVKSAMRLGQARGAAMVAAASNEIPIYEYSARKVKQSMTGNGNAHKEQVQFMVKARLGMDIMPEPIDASDALAVALCHQYQMRNMDL